MTKKQISKIFQLSVRNFSYWENQRRGTIKFLEIAAEIKHNNITNYQILKLYQFYSYFSKISSTSKNIKTFLLRKNIFEKEEELFEKAKRIFDLDLTEEELKAFIVLSKKDFKN